MSDIWTAIIEFTKDHVVDISVGALFLFLGVVSQGIGDRLTRPGDER